jgi:hypothetical protein
VILCCLLQHNRTHNIIFVIIYLHVHCKEPNDNQVKMYGDKAAFSTSTKALNLVPWEVCQKLIMHTPFIIRQVNKILIILMEFILDFLPILLHNRRWVCFQCKSPIIKVFFSPQMSANNFVLN